MRNIIKTGNKYSKSKVTVSGEKFIEFSGTGSDYSGINSLLYKAAYNNSVAGMFFTDLNGCILDCNPALAGMYALAKSSLTGKYTIDFLSPHSAEQYSRTLSAIISTKKSEEELQIIKPDGKLLEVWRTTILVESGSENNCTLMITDEDITENWIKEELLLLQGTALKQRQTVL